MARQGTGRPGAKTRGGEGVAGGSKIVPPPETAKALVRYALELEAQERHAGGCADPGEKAAWQAVQRWLRAWRGGQLGQAPTPTEEESEGRGADR